MVISGKGINKGLRTFLIPYACKTGFLHSNPLVFCCSLSLSLQISFVLQLSSLFTIVIAPKKKMALLTIPGSNIVPVPTPRHMAEAPVVKDSFWGKALNETVEANFVLEYRTVSSNSRTSLHHQVSRTLFRNNDDGEGFVISPRSVLRRRSGEEVLFYGIGLSPRCKATKFSTNGLDNY